MKFFVRIRPDCEMDFQNARVPWSKTTGKSSLEFQFRPFDSDIQNENLINEFKGNLFEFKVAQLLGKRTMGEIEFVESIPETFFIQLNSYQNYLLRYRPQLLGELDQNAQRVIQKLEESIDIDSYQTVELLGKLISASRSEADIRLKKEKEVLDLSLKYTKKNAWLNTKSGGIKSFYKYFETPEMLERQRELSSIAELEFEKLAIQLHEIQGIEYLGSFESWRQQGFSELPGSLTGECRDRLYQYYQVLSEKIYRDLLELKKRDSQAFANGLWSLVGFQEAQVLQVVCFTESSRAQIHLSSRDDLDRGGKIELLQTDSYSSFEIRTKGYRLQIRVKPMNKFTVAGAKINCSIRYND